MIDEVVRRSGRRSINYRRNGTLPSHPALVSDVIFYDKKYNPGDPIPVDANFRPDVDEMSLPADYEEQGDEEDQPDES